MSELQYCEVTFLLHAELGEAEVPDPEMRLLSSYFPQILKEMMVQAEPEEE